MSLATDIVARLRLDTSGVKTGMGAVNKEVAGLEKSFKRMGSSIAAYFSLRQVSTYFKNLFDDARKIANIAENFDVTVETMQALKVQAELSSAGFAKLEKVFVKLKESQNSLTDNSDRARREMQALRDAGVDLDKYFGGDLTTKFDLVAKAMAEMGTEADATNFALNLFGEKIGARTVTMLREIGAVGVKAYTDTAKAQGLIFSEEQNEKMQEASTFFFLWGKTMEVEVYNRLTQIGDFWDELVDRMKTNPLPSTNEELARVLAKTESKYAVKLGVRGMAFDDNLFDNLMGADEESEPIALTGAVKRRVEAGRIRQIEEAKRMEDAIRKQAEEAEKLRALEQAIKEIREDAAKKIAAINKNTTTDLNVQKDLVSKINDLEKEKAKLNVDSRKIELAQMQSLIDQEKARLVLVEKRIALREKEAQIGLEDLEIERARLAAEGEDGRARLVAEKDVAEIEARKLSERWGEIGARGRDEATETPEEYKKAEAEARNAWLEAQNDVLAKEKAIKDHDANIQDKKQKWEKEIAHKQEELADVRSGRDITGFGVEAANSLARIGGYIGAQSADSSVNIAEKQLRIQEQEFEVLEQIAELLAQKPEMDDPGGNG